MTSCSRRLHEITLCLSDFLSQWDGIGTNCIKVQTCSNCVRWGFVSRLEYIARTLSPSRAIPYQLRLLALKVFLSSGRSCCSSDQTCLLNALYSLCVVWGNSWVRHLLFKFKLVFQWFLVVVSGFPVHANLQGVCGPNGNPLHGLRIAGWRSIVPKQIYWWQNLSKRAFAAFETLA